MLALQFVEEIDDAIFKVLQRGFFGRTLKDASDNIVCIVTSKESHAWWTKRLVRFVYALNMCGFVIALIFFAHQQNKGAYRCNSFSVTFGDEMFENAWVKLDNGTWAERLLIYSHFNGIYKENRKYGRSS